METKTNQPKINHYKYMKQKVKSKKILNKNKRFQDCLAEWDEEEDTKEKLTTPISVWEHYKKYIVEERKNNQLEAHHTKGQKMQRRLI